MPKIIYLYIFSFLVVQCVNKPKPQAVNEGTRVNIKTDSVRINKAEEKIEKLDTSVFVINNKRYTCCHAEHEIRSITFGIDSFIFQYYINYSLGTDSIVVRLMKKFIVFARFVHEDNNDILIDISENSKNAEMINANYKIAAVNRKLEIKNILYYIKWKWVNDWKFNITFDSAVVASTKQPHENGSLTVKRIKENADTFFTINNHAAWNFVNGLNNINFYGYGTASCFTPGMYLILFNKQKPVVVIAICMDCNYMYSSISIPASDGLTSKIHNSQSIWWGFSPAARQHIINLAKVSGHFYKDYEAYREFFHK